MVLTEEQKEIIDSTGDIKINAVAGSGKTTTLIELIRVRSHSNNKFLYLAFNNSVRRAVKDKLTALGMRNVRVETAHSLAYSHIIRKNNYSIENNYKINQIRDILNIHSSDNVTSFVIANHIKRFTSYYCNSNASKVQELDYLATITDPVARIFVSQFYEQIEYGTRLFLTKMLRGDIGVTHDFYLKLFQLGLPRLKYDYILFDEGQDASPSMLDVFLKQNATKVIVGDTHQQIYGWRYAINSLEFIQGFKEHYLTSSFRLDKELADAAMSVLNWKRHLNNTCKPVTIKGVAEPRVIETKATLARTNLKLLMNAVSRITGFNSLKNIYFEGNINSYTYAGEGASLFDVLNLSLGNFHLIRDEMIRSMKSIEELKTYTESSEEADLAMMIGIVDEYGAELPKLLTLLKEKHVEDGNKQDAEMVFSTVHRCKGLEYGEVTLEKDFITEDIIIKNASSASDGKYTLNSMIEEINLLYVAITRTYGKLRMPEELMDQYMYNLILGSHKHTIISEGKNSNVWNPVDSGRKSILHKNNWNDDLDIELEKKLQKKIPLKFIAKQMNLPRKEVIKRIRELELYIRYDIQY